MAVDPPLPSLDPLPSRSQRIQKAFSQLDSQRALLANCATGWKELEEYFSELHKTIQSKFEELAQKEAEFAAKAKEDKVALSVREEAISARETASLERVQEQKDVAIAELLEEKRKWIEGHQGKGSSSIPATLPLPSGVGSSPLKSDSVVADGQAKSLLADIKLRPQLRSLCEAMDAEGLLKYLNGRQKESTALRIELSSALQACPDPVRLVFNALESYDDFKIPCILLLEFFSLVLADPVLGVDHPVVSSNVKELAKEVARSWRSKMDIHGDAVAVSSLDAHAFLQLLATFGIGSEYKDELGKLFAVIVPLKEAPALSRSLGLSAELPDLVAKFAKEGKQIEALSYAKSFGIMEKIQPVSLLKEYLKEVRVAAHLSAKNAPTIIAGQSESIIKELSAVNKVLKAVERYNLQSQFPTDILHKRVEQLEKAEEERKHVVDAVKFLQKHAPKHKKARKCVANHQRYFKSKLKQKLGLEKKSKKPQAVSKKPQSVSKKPRSVSKKPRLEKTATTGFVSSAGTVTAPVAAGVVTTHKNPLHRPSERAQYGGAFPSSHSLPTASAYDRQPQPGFGSAYDTGTKSLAPLSSSYVYPSDGIGSAYGSTSAYPTLSGSYGGYQYTSALAPPSTTFLSAPPSTYLSAPPSAYQSVPPATYQSFTR